MRAKITARLIASTRPETKPFEVRDTEVKGFILRVQPSGEMVFYCEYRDSTSRKRRISIGSAFVLTVPQARDAAVGHIRAAKLGDSPAQKRKEARQAAMTLRELMTGLYSEHLARKGCRTAARVVRLVEISFPEWWDKPISEITRWKLDKWRLHRAEDEPLTRKGTVPRKVSLGSINRPIEYLKAALAVAVENGKLPAHPLAGIRLRREPETMTRFLDNAELARLMDVLNARDAEMHDRALPFIVVALHAGLRQHEVETLDWADVDLDRRIVTVRPVNAKSGRMRHIPVNATLRGVLEAWQSRTGGEGPVFTQGYPKRAWLAALKKAKIVNFRFHDTRHTFASRLVMGGVDMFTVQKLLGHASPLMTQRYSHLAPDHLAAAVARLDVPVNVVPIGKEQTA